MTKVSRIPLRPDIKQNLLTEFWYTLGTLDRKDIETFLKELLSPPEVIMLAKRIEILKQLQKKLQYAHIKQNMNVLEPTIAKMSIALQRSNEHFKIILKRLIEDEDVRWKAQRERYKPHWRGKMVNYVPKKLL